MIAAMPRPVASAKVLVAVFALLLGAMAAGAEEYRVGVNDQLGLRVQDWLSVEGEIRQWEAMTGEHVVGADGAIAVPFVGAVAAAGRTTAEIGAEIAERLRERFALSATPDAAVSVLRHRPVYVTGLVRSGGEYPFAPGLTVAQAVGLAGGLGEVFSAGSAAGREMVQAEGMLRIYERQYLRLAVKKARLDAEIAGEAEIGEISGLPRGASLDAVVLDETLVLTARREQIAREIEGFERRTELYEAEISALEQKREALERQLELGREGVANTAELAERGLAASARVLDSERQLAAIEGQLLDISTAILQARQGIATAETEAATLRDGFRSEVAIERLRIDTDLEEIGQRIQMQEALALDAARVAGEAAQGLTPLLPAAGYEIRRVEEGAERIIAATGATPLMPGDVLEVVAAAPAVR